MAACRRLRAFVTGANGFVGTHLVAHLRAVAATHGPVALVHFDSHSDLWDQYWGQRYTHGTPFRRAVEEGLIDVGRSSQIGLRGSLYDAEDAQVGKSFGFQVYTMDDVRAVMDAVDSERAAIFGYSEGGPLSVLFAATYPARTVALVLYGTYAKRRDPTDDYPWAATRSVAAARRRTGRAGPSSPLLPC